MDDRYACRQMVVAATIWKCMGPMLVAAMMYKLLRLNMVAHKTNKYSERLQLLKLPLV